MSDLVARLRKELPTVTERESVWCSVQGYDLREAVILLESLSAQVVQLRGALAELVAVNDMRIHFVITKGVPIEYRRREPAAWAAARATLQGQQGEPTP